MIKYILKFSRINEVASDLFFTVTMLPNFKSFKNCGSLAHKDRHEGNVIYYIFHEIFSLLFVV